LNHIDFFKVFSSSRFKKDKNSIRLAANETQVHVLTLIRKLIIRKLMRKCGIKKQKKRIEKCQKNDYETNRINEINKEN